MPQCRKYGEWVGQGPLARDDRTYWVFPVKDMVRQCGLLVSRDDADGSYDRCEPADEPLCCARTAAGASTTTVPAYVAMPTPLCLYHFDSPGVGFLGDSGSKSFHLGLELLEEG